MTIGDVMAMIGGVTLLSVSTWALLVGGAMLFSRRAAAAQARLETAPWRALGIGVLVVAVGGVGGVALLNQPNGLMKLIGWAMLMGVLAVGALGGTGLALLAGDRVRRFDERFSAFGALCRGGGFLVVAGLVPLLGWLVVTPMMLIASLGAGFHALLRRREVAPPVAVETSAASVATAPIAAMPVAAMPAATRDEIATAPILMRDDIAASTSSAAATSLETA